MRHRAAFLPLYADEIGMPQSSVATYSHSWQGRHSAAPPSAFSRCFNSDGKGVLVN